QIIFLNACDVGLVALVKGMLGTAMPSRTYNIMAAGKPILALAEKGSELEKVISEEGIGWCVEPGCPQELHDQILRIFDIRSELGGMGQRAREAALAKYTPSAAIEAYQDALIGTD
ncbi:MAG: glycosyltransferase WbuB, partial [Pyrinomonadaceae bacterium]